MTPGARAFALLLAATVLSAVPSQAQTVSGGFTMNGKSLKPMHVAAFRVRNQNAARTMETYVMLTLTPVDVRVISNSLTTYLAAINDPAVLSADYLALQVSDSGEVTLNAHVGGTQYMDSSGKLMGDQGSLVATCRENTTARVACTVKTPKPVKPIDGPSWTLDVTFMATVLSRVPGKPLPPDGGPAGKALLDLVAAVGGKNLATILAGLSPSEAESYQRTSRSPAENLASAKEMLGLQLAKKPKVTGGEMLANDHIVLEVEGVPFENVRMLYLYQMRLIEGRWRYDGGSQAGMLR